MVERLPPSPVRTLAGTRLFEGMAEGAIAAVMRGARTHRLRKGDGVFAAGEPAARCHLLIEGRVKIVQTGADGAQMLLRFIGPGDVFGAIAALSGQEYPGDAVAISDGTEASWSTPELRRQMLLAPRLAMNLLTVAGLRLQELQQRMREVATEPVEQRVAHALLRLARQAGHSVDLGMAIDLPLRRQDIAEMTGTTLYTVSRILTAWQQQSIATGNRQRIVIIKPHAVTRIAGEPACHCLDDDGAAGIRGARQSTLL